MQPQFKARFIAGVRYLRDKRDGTVYPYNPILAEDTNRFKVVIFKRDVSVVPKPIGYVPEPPAEPVEQEEDNGPEMLTETNIERANVDGSQTASTVEV